MRAETGEEPSKQILQHLDFFEDLPANASNLGEGAPQIQKQETVQQTRR